jgi:hypothetical protein
MVKPFYRISEQPQAGELVITGMIPAVCDLDSVTLYKIRLIILPDRAASKDSVVVLTFLST